MGHRVISFRHLMKNGYISKQEYRTFKGQVLNGDKDAAMRGLKRLMKRRGVIAKTS